MDFLPFLSVVFEHTMSKYVGVSSMLTINSYRKSQLILFVHTWHFVEIGAIWC